MTNPAQISFLAPALVDAGLLPLQARLETLGWLTTAYGRAQVFTKEMNGGAFTFPAIGSEGANGLDYIPGNMFPDEHKGNFSWFDVKDGEQIQVKGGKTVVNFSAGLVVWADMRTVYPTDWRVMSVANLVNDVLAKLTGGGFGGGLSIDETSFRVQYRAEAIYQGYSHQEAKRQFLQKPYAGFRIDFDAKHVQQC